MASFAALFGGLFDDASLFPPGNSPMPEAIRAHARHRASWYAGTVGPFVCAAPRLDDLAAQLKTTHIPRLELALTVPDGVAAVQSAIGAAARSGQVQLRAVEVPLGRFDPAQAARILGASAEGLGFGAYVEIAPGDLTGQLARTVGAAGLRLKLRTGGTTAAAFPSEARLATALVCAVGAGLAFKCTAGLHHAVRHRDPQTGFEHHGFLNVLVATHVAAMTGSADAAAAALAERDPDEVAARVRALTDSDAAALRGQFCSFGTCSIAEPMAELVALDLAAAP